MPRGRAGRQVRPGCAGAVEPDPVPGHIRGMSANAPDGPGGYLTIQFLAWIAEAPRTYGEAMDAWRTSCPRLSIWDDAVIDGLVRVGSASGKRGRVVLTERGRALLEDCAALSGAGRVEPA